MKVGLGGRLFVIASVVSVFDGWMEAAYFSETRNWMSKTRYTKCEEGWSHICISNSILDKIP